MSPLQLAHVHLQWQLRDQNQTTPLSDLESVGTPIDPETGEDFELVGAAYSAPLDLPPGGPPSYAARCALIADIWQKSSSLSTVDPVNLPSPILLVFRDLFYLCVAIADVQEPGIITLHPDSETSKTLRSWYEESAPVWDFIHLFE